MESLDRQYGFDDHLFLCEIPDYLRCVACSLVLRDPIQILTCGHKFCSHCFDQMKKYAENKNTEFYCPVDRDIVDMSKVHEDIAMKRAVGNLKVRCEAHDDGCLWNGDLSDIQKHSKQCTYQQRKHLYKGQTVVTNDMMRDLCNKVAKCETWMADKEREMADKDKQIITLKHQMQEMREESLSTKLSIQELKEELLSTKNMIKELKEESLPMKKHMQELKDEIFFMKQNMGDRFVSRDEVADLKKEIKELKYSLKAQNQPLQTTEETSYVQLDTLQQLGDNSLYQSTSFSTGGNKFNTSENIFIEHHRGANEDIVLQNTYRVQFKRFSTVRISNVSVGRGRKVWYELKYWCTDDSLLRIGWASNSLTKIDHHVVKGVGDVSQSYGFDPIYGGLCFEGKCMDNQQFIRFQSVDSSYDETEENYVGVALDMEEGRMLYSVNGVWNETTTTGIGIQFHRINLNTEFFPAISGDAVTVEVNFGDQEFEYSGPPDDSYKTLVEIASIHS